MRVNILCLFRGHDICPGNARMTGRIVVDTCDRKWCKWYEVRLLPPAAPTGRERSYSLRNPYRPGELSLDEILHNGVRKPKP